VALALGLMAPKTNELALALKRGKVNTVLLQDKRLENKALTPRPELFEAKTSVTIFVLELSSRSETVLHGPHLCFQYGILTLTIIISRNVMVSLTNGPPTVGVF